MKNSPWEQLENSNPSSNPDLCREIQGRAEEILAGAPLSEELQHHRETCLVCIRYLREKLLEIKGQLPERPKVAILKSEEGSYAAGVAEGLRSLSSSELCKVGLSSGWHIDIQPIDSEQLKIYIVSDLPKNIHMTLLNQEDNTLAILNLSQLPVYLDQKTALLVDKIILKEID